MAEQTDNNQVLTFNSSTDYSSSGQYTLMIQNTTNDNEVTQSGLDGVVIGVLQNNPKANEAASIAYGGRLKVVYGDTITVGAVVCSDASGRAIPLASNHNIVGIALKAGVVGDVGEIIFFRYYK